MPNKITTYDDFSGEDVLIKMFQMWRYLRATRIDFSEDIGSIAISGVYYEMGFLMNL